MISQLICTLESIIKCNLFKRYSYEYVMNKATIFNCIWIWKKKKSKCLVFLLNLDMSPSYFDYFEYLSLWLGGHSYPGRGPWLCVYLSRSQRDAKDVLVVATFVLWKIERAVQHNVCRFAVIKCSFTLHCSKLFLY